MQTDQEDANTNMPSTSGRTTSAFGADDAADKKPRDDDNKNTREQENSANGLDSLEVRGGEDGRNERAIGSTDMDGQHGVLRTGDQDDGSAPQVPDEALADAAHSDARTNTSMTDVTTSGPDDYGSARQVGVPVAQEEAKKQDDPEEKTPADADAEENDKTDDDVAQTGTDLTNKPEY